MQTSNYFQQPNLGFFCPHLNPSLCTSYATAGCLQNREEKETRQCQSFIYNLRHFKAILV